MIERLAIVGLGLLGGSVAKGARARALAREIVAVGRDEAKLAPALRDGTVDRVSTELEAGLRGADFVLLATPVLVIEELLPRVAKAVGSESLVTDVGSTKGRIVGAAERLGTARPFHFVGSHPMAGSERSGYGVAAETLIPGATVFVTPTEATAPRVVKDVTGFWEALGARVSALDPVTHDRVVAAISHLPHLIACALVEAARRFEAGALPFAGSGFRDTTRIAAADPQMWQEIFVANREAMLGSVRDFRAALAELEGLIASADSDALQRWLAAIKAARDNLR